MIVNLRGPSGSGKSTIVREVMGRFPRPLPHHVNDRRQPLWYDLLDEGRAPLRVLGHYEADCGGCDTISKARDGSSTPAVKYIHQLVRQAHEEGRDVLYEGVILSTVNHDLLDMVREGLPVRVVWLDLELEECLQGIASRRAGRLGTDPMRERSQLTDTTISNNGSKRRSATTTARQLMAAGAVVAQCSSREAARVTVLSLLGLL